MFDVVDVLDEIVRDIDRGEPSAMYRDRLADLANELRPPDPEDEQAARDDVTSHDRAALRDDEQYVLTNLGRLVARALRGRTDQGNRYRNAPGPMATPRRPFVRTIRGTTATREMAPRSDASNPADRANNVPTRRRC